MQSRAVAAVLLVLLLGTQLPAAAGAGAGESRAANLGETVLQSAVPSAGVRLVSSTDSGVVLEVTVPWEQVQVREMTLQGKQYSEVEIAGWSSTGQAGAPQLPMAEAALGAPFGVSLSVRVEPGAGHVLELPAAPVPVATMQARWNWDALAQGGPWLPDPQRDLLPDVGVYGSGEVYPGKLAAVENDGAMRQQRVIGVGIYPVQYDAAMRTITVFESLRITVTFEGKATLMASREIRRESAAFEEILQRELLNYASAARWRGDGTEASRLSSGTVAGSEGRPRGPVPWAPPVPGYKVRVKQTGFYKLTYSQLAAAGVPVDDLDPRTLKLYAGGGEVAVYVEGESDGKLNPSDYVLFYGQAVNSKYTPYNVYWLTYGQGNGLRMQSRNGTPSAGTVPLSYSAHQPMGENLIYIPVLLGDENLERFVWDYLYPPSRPGWSYTFALKAPFSTSDNATLNYALFGYLSSTINPDHHTQVYVNGVLVEDAWWDGIAWRMGTVQFPQSLLTAGDNTISIVDPNDTGVGYDVVYIDWLELDFANTYAASGDSLAFSYTTAGLWKYRVEGFSTSDVVAFDVTDAHAVHRIVGGRVVPSGSAYALLFKDQVNAAVDYWATATGQYLAPISIELDTPSDLGSTANGADYIIITHPDFYGPLEALRDYRASQGLRVVEVDVRDVYDEFGYGVEGAGAIHDFIAYTYAHWQAPAPTYVLLVGDGTYDPKNYLGYGRVSYMPPYLAPVDPWVNETATDNRYVSLTQGDTFPDMIVGRFPANSSAEAETLVNKVLLYEQSPEPGDWSDHVLFVADNADQAGDFAQMSNAVIDCCLPDSYQAQKVYYLVTHQSPVEARQAIIGGISSGQLIVNYIGHAAATVWASESLFSTIDLGSLANGQKLPVMLPMTCYDGYFHYPYLNSGDSMGESIVRASGKGAIASWSPTGLGVATGHDRLDRGFYRAAFLDLNANLGKSTMAGKMELWVTGAYRDLIDTYLLFGDPALRMNVQQADVGITKAVDPVTPLAPNDVLTYTLSVVNQGPDVAYHVVITDAMPVFVAGAQVVDTSLGLSQRPGNAFAWDVQDLAPGQSGHIVIRGTVTGAGGVGWFANHAEVAIGNREVGTLPNEDTVLSLVVAGLPGAIEASGTPSRIPVGGSVSTIKALVTDEWGNPVADGTLVSFSTDLGSVSPATSTTNNGLAATTLTSGQVAGQATVTVASGQAQSNALVEFVPGPPATVSLTATPMQIPVGGATSTIVAMVRDPYGNGVADGTAVSFVTTLGSVAPTPVPTFGGLAQTILASGVVAGEAIVSGQAGNAAGVTHVTFVPGPPAVVVLDANPTTIPVGGQSSLVATVRDAWGNPVVDGTLVQFSASLGSVTPASSPTSGGQAGAAFLAGTLPGSALITAVAGGISGQQTVTVLPGAAAVLLLEAAPPTIPLYGTSALSAAVADGYGNPVADGTLVSFASTLGSVAPASAATADGVAQSALHAGGVPGLATVTAQSGSASDSVQVTIGEGTPMTIELTADPQRIVADGVATSTIHALVLDAFGQPITQTIPITFATTLGQVVPPVTWVVDGAATTQLSGTKTGTATVTATAGGASGVVTVELLPGPPTEVTLTSDPDQVPLQGEASLLAHVDDAFGNAVADGTEVAFSATLGNAVPPVAPTTGGQAQSSFHAGLVAGLGVMTATSGGASGTTEIRVLPGAPASLSVQANPAVLVANGQDQSQVMATVTDAYGNLVADGTPVLFASTRGEVEPTSDLTVQGQAHTTLTAGTVAGLATVTAVAASASAAVEVQMIAGPPAVADLVARPTQIPADGQSQASLTVTVTDPFGNPVADGTVVHFAASLGSVTPISGTTEGGVVTATFHAGLVVGVAFVQAWTGSAIGETQIALVAGPAAYISMMADPETIVADGQSESTIRTHVQDAWGHEVADGTPLWFRSTCGNIDPAAGFTVGGWFDNKLQASYTLCTSVITAWTGSVTGSTTVEIVAGPAAVITLSVADSRLPAHGSLKTEVTAVVHDAWDHWVADGTPITVTADVGWVSPEVVTTTQGTAVTTYTGKQIGDWATIVARASTGVSASVQVWLDPLRVYLPVVFRSARRSGAASRR